jgi:hypothetical protein
MDSEPASPANTLVDEQEPPSSNMLILPPSVERELGESDGSLGTLGRPFNHRSPFFIGLTGALGVAVAYVAARGIADISSVLVIIGLALFIAIGLDPILAVLIKLGLRRGVAVGVVTLGFVLLIGAFVLAAVPPLSHDISSLVKNYPHYRANIEAGKGWAGKLAVKLHLTSYLKGQKKLKIPIGGGARSGKAAPLAWSGDDQHHRLDDLFSDCPAWSKEALVVAYSS